MRKTLPWKSHLSNPGGMRSESLKLASDIPMAREDSLAVQYSPSPFTETPHPLEGMYVSQQGGNSSENAIKGKVRKTNESLEIKACPKNQSLKREIAIFLIEMSLA